MPVPEFDIQPGHVGASSGAPAFDIQLGHVGDGPGAGEAALRGAGQGVTLGFGDELAAAAGAALTDNSNKPTFSERYKELRDSFRHDNAAAAEAHPAAFTAGSIAGGAPLAIAAGAGLPAAAAMGAANGLGSSDADNAGDLALDTVKGAALSTAAAGAGKVLSRVPAVAGAIKDVATEPSLIASVLTPGAEKTAAATAGLTAAATGHPIAGAMAAGSTMLAAAGKRAVDAAKNLGITSKVAKAAMTSPGKLGVYGPILAAAFQRGGQQELDANAYVLGQTDPKFQALSAKINEGKDDN